MGTRSGGSLTNRVSPSTTSVSFSSACMLSRVLALASCLVGPGLDLGHGLVGRLFAGKAELVTQVFQHLGDVHSCVPHVEIPHARHGGHLRAVGGGRLENDAGPLLVGEPPIPPGDGQAGGQPLQVPLPRTGQGLVEVVEIEDQGPLGGSEHSEIAEVGVTAGLDVQARAWASWTSPTP